MGDMLSQAEIDALLSGALSIEDESDTSAAEESVALTEQEIDALGEIGNISMGTSATTLYTLLGHKVTITTPKVSVTTWEALSKQYPEPYVAVRVQYTHGIVGTNLLIMREQDVKIITDLMMGGSGEVDSESELSDLHLSAISEAMNQMVGSSATSLSSLFDKRVDISPPESLLIHFSDDSEKVQFDKGKQIVKVAFSLKVGNIIDSNIMQLLPVPFAKELVKNLFKKEETMAPKISTSPVKPEEKAAPKQQFVPPQTGYTQAPPPQAPQSEPPVQPAYGYQQMPYMQPHVQAQPAQHFQNPVNVQPVQFQPFDAVTPALEMQNIGLLMDVPLQITVELGRTSKKIKEILEFGQGSIIELDKLAGEPVDILVNGKNIAKGEVVVIDESFGVRITDIIHPSKRL